MITTFDRLVRYCFFFAETKRLKFAYLPCRGFYINEGSHSARSYGDHGMPSVVDWFNEEELGLFAVMGLKCTGWVKTNECIEEVDFVSPSKLWKDWRRGSKMIRVLYSMKKIYKQLNIYDRPSLGVYLRKESVIEWDWEEEEWKSNNPLPQQIAALYDTEISITIIQGTKVFAAASLSFLLLTRARYRLSEWWLDGRDLDTCHVITTNRATSDVR